MLIKREIDGVEYSFDLTRVEMMQAYMDVSRSYNEKDIIDCATAIQNPELMPFVDKMMEDGDLFRKVYARYLSAIDWALKIHGGKKGLVELAIKNMIQDMKKEDA